VPTTILSEEVNLAGLDIDWHLSDYDMPIVAPVTQYQPIYAYAA